MYDPDPSVPEYTRKNVSLPTNGSVMILKASAANGSLVLRRPLDVVPRARHRARCRRDVRRRGKVVHDRVQQGLDALVLERRPAHHGEDLPLHRRPRGGRARQPSSSRPARPSRYVAMIASSVSASFSTRCARAALAASATLRGDLDPRGTARPGHPRPRSAPSCVTRSTTPDELRLACRWGSGWAPRSRRAWRASPARPRRSGPRPGPSC